MVNNKGRDITDADLLAAAATVDISAQTMREIIRQADEALAKVRQRSD